jgi:hypothetical protein
MAIEPHEIVEAKLRNEVSGVLLSQSKALKDLLEKISTTCLSLEPPQGEGLYNLFQQINSHAEMVCVLTQKMAEENLKLLSPHL